VSLQPMTHSHFYSSWKGWKYSHYLWLVIVLASAILATSAELWLTRGGAGASGDSVHYMQGAENLLAGNGFSRLKANGQYSPITSFPPGFSFSLAGITFLGMPTFEAGRILNALLFGINTALVGLLIYRATRSGVFGILGSWLFMSSGSLIRIHAWIMSEPQFIFLALLSLILLDVYLHRGKFIFLILACLTIGFAGLTRYVGLSLVPAACLSILFIGSKKPVYRWRDAILAGIVSLTPIILWIFHNIQGTGNPVNRQLIYHPISRNLLFSFVDEFSLEIAPSLGLPWRIRWTILAVILLTGLGIYLFSLYEKRHNLPMNQAFLISTITLIFGISYTLVVIFNTNFIDAATDQSTIMRYGFPLIAVAIVWVFSTYSYLAQHGRTKKIAYAGIVLVGLGLAASSFIKSVEFVMNPGYAFGYTDFRRGGMCEVSLLRALPPQQEVITNDYELYYFLAGRPAYTLTSQYDPSLGRTVEDYGATMASIESMLRNGAILASLGDPNSYSGEVNALIGDMGLKITSECSKLRLYSLPPAP
jgi:hypothetical protein